MTLAARDVWREGGRGRDAPRQPAGTPALRVQSCLPERWLSGRPPTSPPHSYNR
jgi:hypothetical protein